MSPDDRRLAALITLGLVSFALSVALWLPLFALAFEWWTK